VSDADDEYLAREARARVNIDRQLAAAGWIVQSARKANVGAGLGVVIREFVLEKGHGRVDYLLFVNGQPAGVIEAKPEGTTLTEVEHQSGKYVDGLPDWIQPPVYPLAFIYESTGTETRFTNGYDPDARSRRVFTFHRPGTPWTRKLWIYDLRTNQSFTLKTRKLTRADLDDFVTCYNPGDRHDRTETDRFHAFGYDELTSRDKASLDIFWLRDESLEDTDNLPAPEVIAAEIVEDLQAALDQFAAVASSLTNGGASL